MISKINIFLYLFASRTQIQVYASWLSKWRMIITVYQGSPDIEWRSAIVNNRKKFELWNNKDKILYED